MSGRKSDGLIGWVLFTITQMLLGSVVEWAVRSNGRAAFVDAASGVGGTATARTGAVAATTGSSDARPMSTGPPIATTQTATLTATRLFLTPA